MIRKTIVLVMLALIASPVAAADIGFISAIGQGTFRSLSKEAGMALAYRVGTPPQPLGTTGFDAGIELSLIDIGSSYWNEAFRGNSHPDYIVLPKLRVRKGLPFGIDIGGMYANASNTNIQLYGAELNKSFFDGNALFPTLALRGSYTKLAGVNDLDIQTVGLDATIGKGIFILTPYAGGGAVWIDSKVAGNLKTLAPVLKNEQIWQPRVFAGVEIKPIPLVRVLVEAEYALRPIYTVKAAIGF